jgi:hypothetical protein
MLSDAKIPVGVYHTLTQDCFNWSATKHGKGKNLRSVSSRFFLLIIASKSSLLLNEVCAVVSVSFYLLEKIAGSIGLLYTAWSTYWC